MRWQLARLEARSLTESGLGSANYIDSLKVGEVIRSRGPIIKLVRPAGMRHTELVHRTNAAVRGDVAEDTVRHGIVMGGNLFYPHSTLKQLNHHHFARWERTQHDSEEMKTIIETLYKPIASVRFSGRVTSTVSKSVSVLPLGWTVLV